MHRLPRLLSPLFIAGLLAVGPFTAWVSAQGTPAAAQPQLEVLAFGVPPTLPSAPALLALARFTYAPGTTYPEPAQPGPQLGYVETGTFTVHASGPVEVQHPVTTNGTPTSTQEASPAAETTLAAGDTILVPSGIAVTFQNSGSATASILGAGVLPAGAVVPRTFPAGLTVKALATGVAQAVPPTSALVLRRDIVPPGAAEPPQTPNRGPLLAYVESGSLAYTLVQGDARVTSPQGSGTPPVPPTAVGLSVETLNPGSSVVEQVGVISGVRNIRTQPASVLIFFLEPPMFRGTPTT